MTTSISRREFLGGAVASATLVGAGGCSPYMANGGKGGDGIVIIR